VSTFLVTGSASGMGRASANRLVADGHRVVGVDLADADICADLSTPEGRQRVLDMAPVSLDGAVCCAGLVGLTGRPGSSLVAVNYFGTVDLLEGLRGRFTRGASVVLFSSNSTTVQPGWNPELVDACLSGDEQAARAIADGEESLSVYPATKVALVRWMRRHVSAWIEQGVRVNAVAPGLIETAMTASVRRDPSLGELIDAFPVPAGRPGTAEEVAALTAFLLSPEAAYLVGSFVVIDGGTEALLRPDAWPARWEL
jgi:NAD(P)-dependent dehydrogenase (short-subunit alcohol dehydrogenase family)